MVRCGQEGCVSGISYLVSVEYGSGCDEVVVIRIGYCDTRLIIERYLRDHEVSNDEGLGGKERRDEQ